MRVIAGEWRGRRLTPPDWDGLRPTSDRLRETLFNILGPSIRGARLLDAFAGTGAVGIEALSRGAAGVVFVEQDARAARLIARNLAALGVKDSVIIRAGLAQAVARLGDERFDIVFVDPPYGQDAVTAALDGAAALAAPAGLLIAEHAARFPAPASQAGFALKRTVKAGDSSLSFYER